jgi:hypothetical protein
MVSVEVGVPVDIVDRGGSAVPAGPDTSQRCDSRFDGPAGTTTCGAQAYVFAELAEGGSLSFCGHHGAMVIEQLRLRGALIADLRSTIPK